MTVFSKTKYYTVHELSRCFHVVQSVQKEKQTFKCHFIGDCKYDSISVALTFNKELCSEVLSQNGLQSLILG